MMKTLYKNMKYWFEYVNRGSYHYWQLKGYTYHEGEEMLEGFLPLDEKITIQDALLLFATLNLK